jgi:2-polyprenyl-3-methyl-5-hydroxy-6-metoxy-1,4-benzoquinol methylase
MANARGKHIDNTHLSIDQAEERGFIHRDYISHCLRWTHVAKYLHLQQRYKTSNVLDIGCGKDVPLAKMMFTSRLVPDTGSYVGVDYNKLEMPEAFKNARWKPELHGGVVFPEAECLGDRKFDVITSFEVVEHVEPLGAFKILEGIKDRLSDKGVAFISTPVFDPQVGAAANHVNEMTFNTLAWMIRKAGLQVDKVYGTFASIRDYKDQLEKDGLKDVFDRLREYYDSNYLATIFAPLYPQLSRNAMWVLSKDKGEHEMPSIDKDSQLSSSDQWQPLFDYLETK